MILALKTGNMLCQAGEKQKQEPSSAIYCAAEAAWDFQEVSDVFYTQRTPTQVWCLQVPLPRPTYLCLENSHSRLLNHRAFCSKRQVFSNKKAFSLQVPYHIFSKYIYAPTQTLQLKVLQC